MQVTQTQNEGLKRGYRFVLPGDELKERVEAKLAEEQPNLQLRGFRKGKVPISLMRQMFGKEIGSQIRESAVQEALTTHFGDTGERPAATPDIDFGVDGPTQEGDLSFDVAYEALPAIPEIDFKAIELERLVATVDEEAVQEALREYATRFGSYENADDRAEAKLGDMLTLDFKGLIDGEEFEQGSGEGFPIVLGEDLLAPGFDEQLQGAKVGAKLSVKVTYPDDYHTEALRGKDAVFSCKVQALKRLSPSPINEDLAAKARFDSLDDLKSDIRESLGERFRADAKLFLRYRLFDCLAEMLDFELPSRMMEAEARSVANQFLMDERRRREAENKDADGSDDPLDTDQIEPTEEHIRIAERRLRLGLLFIEVGRANDIEVNEREFRSAAEVLAVQHGVQSTAYLEAISKYPAVRAGIERSLFEAKVTDFLLELIQVTDKEVSADELRKAVDAIEE